MLILHIQAMTNDQDSFIGPSSAEMEDWDETPPTVEDPEESDKKHIGFGLNEGYNTEIDGSHIEMANITYATRITTKCVRDTEESNMEVGGALIASVRFAACIFSY